MSNIKITEVARNTASLEERIAANVGAQEVDLNEWIFSRFSVPENSNVLELCCGTGAQTAYLAGQSGESGRVYAIDVSSQAIKGLPMKMGEDLADIVVPIAADIDEFPERLKEKDLVKPHFDAIFCAYGLYYSSDIDKTLSAIKEWLNPDGVFAVVGPFGPNNRPLNKSLKLAGVQIHAEAKYASEKFMLSDVATWAVEHFSEVDIYTMVNKITWDDPKELLSYWKNSTFFDESRLEPVSQVIRRHFSEHGRFVNEKWVMLLVAHGMRR
ncbi:MAG: class I SAM-dependent methyltransferase [Deltaproteobacteria bacterium]|nr:class I SAM-dependent methyltransferase [Deltaproteobacteria bacterium]